jgi:arylsulfatase A-like enzyme
MDRCSLAVVRDADCKYVHFAALPPLFFDLRDDPNELVDRSCDPHYAERVRDYAQKMLNWRLAHADKVLTGYRATPEGLECRA